MHGKTAARVGQREGGLPITAILGAQQRKQGCILRNRQHLPFAKCPALWWEVEAAHHNFTYVGLGARNLGRAARAGQRSGVQGNNSFGSSKKSHSA